MRRKYKEMALHNKIKNNCQASTWERTRLHSMKKEVTKKAKVASHGLELNLVLSCSPISYLDACSHLNAFH